MHLLLPGPTPIPEAVQKALIGAMSDHRGTDFGRVQAQVLDGLSTLFKTPSAQHVALMPSSGTGGLEAAVQNLFGPGDTVLVVEGGLFGQRFGEIAQAHQLQVDRLQIPWGQAFSTQAILDRVRSASYQGVLVTHNETSTGVLNPVEDLADQLQQLDRSPLLVVDSISGVPSIPLTVDHGIDTIIAASQKGFMCPPGLALAALSQRARETVLQNRPGRFYFDFRPYLMGRLPYTPAISLWYGLHAALALLFEEGAESRLQRHIRLRNMVRAFAQAGGFPPLVDDAAASPTVTALRVPADVNPHDLRRRLVAQGLQIAGGVGAWHDQVIRIGHVGAVDVGDLWAGLGLLAPHMPHPNQALAAAAAAMDKSGGDN